MPAQKFTQQDIDQLSAWLQRRYEAQFAFRSSLSMFANSGIVRGAWPMSQVAYTNPQALDATSNGLHLTNNNGAQFGYDGLVPYVEFNGSTQYLSHVDGGVLRAFDIIGNESYVKSAQRGLTLGGWFWIDQSTGANQNLMAKTTGVGAARSYFISYVNATALPNFTIASGAVSTQVDGTAGTTGTVSFNTWFFWCGRFIPSTSLTIFLNGKSNTNAAAIPATINDSTAPFTIGANGIPGVYHDGRASMYFLCAGQLSDAFIGTLFEQTKAMYGVK
jgi:hypothetical protein